MAPPQPVSAWSECMQHVKFWRSEIKRSFGEPLNQVELVEDSEVNFEALRWKNLGEMNAQVKKSKQNPPIIIIKLFFLKLL